MGECCARRSALRRPMAVMTAIHQGLIDGLPDGDSAYASDAMPRSLCPGPIGSHRGARCSTSLRVPDRSVCLPRIKLQRGVEMLRSVIKSRPRDPNGSVSPGDCSCLSTIGHCDNPWIGRCLEAPVASAVDCCLSMAFIGLGHPGHATHAGTLAISGRLGDRRAAHSWRDHRATGRLPMDGAWVRLAWR